MPKNLTDVSAVQINGVTLSLNSLQSNINNLSHPSYDGDSYAIVITNAMTGISPSDGELYRQCSCKR